MNLPSWIKLDETNDTNHPGRKPLDFLVTWIEKLTKPGDFIIDPFLGSGTTLFAADETNRTFCGAEISPKYCTEIIGRWLLLNKEKPLKIWNLKFSIIWILKRIL